MKKTNSGIDESVVTVCRDKVAQPYRSRVIGSAQNICTALFHLGDKCKARVERPNSVAIVENRIGHDLVPAALSGLHIAFPCLEGGFSGK